MTFHRAVNYGAVLQAFALQKSLEIMGNDVDILDIRGDRVDKMYSYANPFSVTAKGGIRLKIRTVFRRILDWTYNQRRRKEFDKFLNEHLKLSKSVYSDSDLKELSKDYDFFFCGSDQVWNLNVTDSNDKYFLSFADCDKRNSYAASFGKSTIDAEQMKAYKEYLCGFNKISVRENTSIELVKSITGTSAELVLDPTLLLDKSQWKKLLGISERKEKYILVYMLYDLKNTDMIDFVRKLHDDTKLPIYYIGKNRYFKMGKQLHNVLPSEWVGLFCNATYIVTNSFHGTCFSINFHIPFFTFLLQPKSRPANVRIKDLLEMVGLEERIVTSVNDVKTNVTIDWNVVDKGLDKARGKSIKFIKEVENSYA